MRQERDKINFKYNLSVYWGFLKKYKVIAFLILFFSLITEAKSVVDKFLFKTVIDGGTEFLSGALASAELTNTLFIVAIVFLSASAISVIANWFEIHFINRLESNMIVDLKRKFFNHLITLDHSFHISHKTGAMISRIIRGGGAMERMTDVIAFNFITILFQLAVVTFSLIYLDKFSAVIISATVVVFITYSLYIQKISESASLEANKREDIEKGNISDIFTNIDSIKYFGKEDIIKGNNGRDFE